MKTNFLDYVILLAPPVSAVVHTFIKTTVSNTVSIYFILFFLATTLLSIVVAPRVVKTALSNTNDLAKIILLSLVFIAFLPTVVFIITVFVLK